MWYSHLTKYYSVIKRYKVLIHVTALMNCKNIMLSERNQVQKATYCRIPFYRKCLGKANLLKQKADQQLLKAVGKSGINCK